MKAVQEYKKAIGELNHLFEVFTSAIDADGLTASALKTWSIEDVKVYADSAIRYKPNQRIKEELIGDAPDKETLKRRLEYVTMELVEQPPFGDNYFPQYDTHYYSLGNIELVDALKKINGDGWAFGVAQQLGHTALWANAMIEDTFNMLAKLCQYVGISPEPLKVKQSVGDDPNQQAAAPEPQQITQEFETDEAKELLGKALEKRLIMIDGNKYKWADSASLYGYFVDKTSDFLNIRHSNNRIPWKKYGTIITNHSEILATAKQAVNDYKNKKLPPPEGDDIVNGICK